MTQPTPSSVDAMRQALEDVCNPLGYLRRKAEAEGNRLGGMAYAIANDIATVQQIARDALSTLPSDGVTIPADGWTRLPAEPTEEMVAAGEAVDGTITARDVYAAMLAAAPKAPPVAQAEGVERERIARIVDPSAWHKRDKWTARLRGEGDWPDDPAEVDMMRRSYERRMPLLTADSLAKADAILAALSATTEQGEGEATGTFACPICGQDTPHHHGAEAVDALQHKGSRK